MDIQELIRQRAIAAGVDPVAALTIARIESSFNPSSNMNAATQYKGLYQLGRDEWAKHGTGNIYDPAANTDAFLKLYNNNASALAKSLGRDVTPQETYLAHQQGVAGATALIKNPDMNAVDAIAPFYRDRATAISAIKGNGGDPNAPASDFANLWTTKYNKFAQGFGGDPNAPTTVATNNTTPATPATPASPATPIASAMPGMGLLSSNGAQPMTDGSMGFNPMGLLSSGLQAMGAAQQQQPQMKMLPPSVHRPRNYDNLFAGLLG